FLPEQRKPPRLAEAGAVVDAFGGFVVGPEEPRRAESGLALRVERAEHEHLAEAASALRCGDADRSKALILIMRKRNNPTILHRRHQPRRRIPLQNPARRS